VGIPASARRQRQAQLSEQEPRLLRKAARKRGTTQSGLIVQLVETGLAAEAGQIDRMVSFVRVIHGPPDLSETIDRTVYGG
jgi:hypothetical protein